MLEDDINNTSSIYFHRSSAIIDPWCSILSVFSASDILTKCEKHRSQSSEFGPMGLDPTAAPVLRAEVRRILGEKTPEEWLETGLGWS